ncbi:MAG: DUF1177 domain-containing protein [Chloroflexi bacterium]|nr:DUF1177 domain-containing protein [Chloroflexota bacterium]
MALKQVLEVYELLDSATVEGAQVADLFARHGMAGVYVERVTGPLGHTDFVSGVIPGAGDGPTLGVIGRLGGIGARPAQIGLVSDADGAIVALSAALKLADMAAAGDVLPGPVRFATHICTHAPTTPHEPTPFMGSPVEIGAMNAMEVHEEMQAILSVDTTRGNRVINQRGFAISPTVREGYILRVSEDLLNIMSWVTGRAPIVFPITTQDITPYGNGLYHLNSILQPATATSAPVVGVALTAEVAVPGPATGASQVYDMEATTRFCVEVAKAFTAGRCRFHDADEWGRMQALYGSLSFLQKQRREA